MDGENIYDKIQEIFGQVPGSFSILEEQIDIDLQMEYFEVSRLAKKDLDPEKVMEEKDEIFNQEREKRERKSLFAKLASVELVEAYRTIEQYLKEEHAELRSWAVLAHQESRMLIESKLLEENQVFISTGLGGKGSSLRYFVVFILKKGADFLEWQKKTVRNELEVVLKESQAEIEDLQFTGEYATLLAVVPLKVSLKETFRKIIEECNRYGDFLRTNFIITNVRILNQQEIRDFLKRQETANKKGND